MTVPEAGPADRNRGPARRWGAPEAVAPFLGKNQMHPFPFQLHPRSRIVTEKPVQREHGRALFTAYVLAWPGKSIHVSDVRP